MATVAQNSTILNGSAQFAMATRVVLADEMTLVREGFANICESAPNCEVVGQASDGHKALQLLMELRPDVAFLDWQVPGMFALEVIKHAKSAGLPTRFGIVSARAERKTVLEALRGGAMAFVLKSGPSGQIHDAIAHMMAGEVYMSPLIDASEIQQAQEKKQQANDPFETLSPREFQVFTMLVDGVRAKEIAARLGLSPKTVDTYRSSLMEKLEIYDVAGLVKFAISRSMVQPR